MTQPHPPFLSRLSLALSSFFAILSRPAFAADVQRLQTEGWPSAPVTPAPAPVVTPPPSVAPAPVPVAPAPETAALQLLALLQAEARLIDFVQEDVQAYSDADIGAAARVVHAGCRKVLQEHLSLAPVRSEAEGSRVTLPVGFNASEVRVIGQVLGQPPFHGTLVHRGWKVTDVRLPQAVPGHDARTLAQAEVEL